MSETWMTTEEIAYELGVSGPTVRRILEREGVPVMRLGAKLRVKKADYEAMVASRFGPYKPEKQTK